MEQEDRKMTKNSGLEAIWMNIKFYLVVLKLEDTEGNQFFFCLKNDEVAFSRDMSWVQGALL